MLKISTKFIKSVTISFWEQFEGIPTHKNLPVLKIREPYLYTLLLIMEILKMTILFLKKNIRNTKCS